MFGVNLMIRIADRQMRCKQLALFVLLLTMCLPCLVNLIVGGLLRPLSQHIYAVQKLYRMELIKPLSGAYTQVEWPRAGWKGWFSGEFQKQCEKYIEQNIGFRSFFVRFKNQVDYVLFSVSNSPKIVVGKSGYLYEQSYIDAYLGRDFAGIVTLEKTVQEAKALQVALKDRNVDFFIVMAPGKASFFSEFIPDRYASLERKMTNHGYLQKRFQEEGIHHLDMYAEFMLMKQTSPYRLYPKSGIHWSNYGAAMMAVSLKNHMEGLRHIKMTGVGWSNVVVTTVVRMPDNDLGELMNTLFDIPQLPLAYPDVMFSADPAAVKPKVLVVGDSYYWNLIHGGFVKQLFGEEEFWYYNSSIFRNGEKSPFKVSEIDVKSEVERQDFVVIMNTDACLGNLGHGFINQAYNLFVRTPSFQDGGKCRQNSGPGRSEKL